jgi:hypothetical protein
MNSPLLGTIKNRIDIRSTAITPYPIKEGFDLRTSWNTPDT